VRTAALVLLLGSTSLAASSPGRVTRTARADVPHDVTLRIEAMGSAPVVGHLVSPGGGERALRPWGRALLFRRSADGDLLPQAHTMQLVPPE
jgi:hypothetical protein